MTSRFNSKRPEYSLLLLAPTRARTQNFRGRITASRQEHGDLLKSLQRLRGKLYSEDGAVDPTTLTPDGRHTSCVDESSWHLVTVNEHRDVVGCTRFHDHHPSAVFQDLSVRHAPLAECQVWGPAFKSAISADLSAAQKRKIAYVEVGGWALSRDLRGTSEALKSILATFAWAQLLGGAIGVSTATERNSSASILRRLGGHSLQWNGSVLPSYYDDQYKCKMEVLRFEAQLPSPRFLGEIENLRKRLATVEIIQPQAEEVAREPLSSRIKERINSLYSDSLTDYFSDPIRP